MVIVMTDKKEPRQKKDPAPSRKEPAEKKDPAPSRKEPAAEYFQNLINRCEVLIGLRYITQHPSPGRISRGLNAKVFLESWREMVTALTNPKIKTLLGLFQVDEEGKVVRNKIPARQFLGFIESAESFNRLTQVILFVHVALPENIFNRLDSLVYNHKVCDDNLCSDGKVVKKKADGKKKADVFSFLEVFCALAQVLTDHKVNDLLWFIAVTHIAQLVPYVLSSQPLHLWPDLLRNAVAHSQAKIIGPVFSAFNITKLSNDSGKPEKNWELACEVNFLLVVLYEMFSRITRALCKVQAKPSQSEVQARLYTNAAGYFDWDSPATPSPDSSSSSSSSSPEVAAAVVKEDLEPTNVSLLQTDSQ